MPAPYYTFMEGETFGAPHKRSRRCVRSQARWPSCSSALGCIGIIRTGLLAVPVLANSATYALAETLKWPIGLDRKFHRAKGFYGILTLATVLGLGLNFTSIDPINALFWSAVVDGVVAIPIMLTMMLMTANPKVIGTLALPLPQKTNRMDCDLRNV